MPNGKWPPSPGGVDRGEVLVELWFDSEVAIRGAEGVDAIGWGDAATTATFASRAVALDEGDLQRSLSHCIVDEPVTLTEGGVTEGGVNGDRLCLGEGSLWAGSEINIFVGVKANPDDVSTKECDKESSDDLLLLFKATVNGNWRALIGFYWNFGIVVGGFFCCCRLMVYVFTVNLLTSGASSTIGLIVRRTDFVDRLDWRGTWLKFKLDGKWWVRAVLIFISL